MESESKNSHQGLHAQAVLELAENWFSFAKVVQNVPVRLSYLHFNNKRIRKHANKLFLQTEKKIFNLYFLSFWVSSINIWVLFAF